MEEKTRIYLVYLLGNIKVSMRIHKVLTSLCIVSVVICVGGTCYISLGNDYQLCPSKIGCGIAAQEKSFFSKEHLSC